MKKELLSLAACLLIAVVIFSIHLGGYDLWPPDEPRYALVAREMMDSGDYMLPHVNNQPYKEKPPLLFWCISLVSAIPGEVTAWSARIPSVLSGLIVLLFTYLLARELFSPRVALWSVLILLSMQRFWWNSRFGQIDMLLTACLTVGWYMFWQWEQKRRPIWLVGFYAAAIAGLYAKGPGVMVFPFLFVLAWSWPDINRRKAWVHLVIGSALCVLAYALWAVPAHIGFARDVQAVASDTLASNMFRQTLGRFFLGVSHANWPWYYLTSLPFDWLPWTVFLPWVLIWSWKHRRDGASMRFVLCWIIPAFLFFSTAIGKRGVYLLPLFPAFSMLFAAGVLDFMDSDKVQWRKRISRVYALFLLVLGVAPFILLLTEYKSLWTSGLALFGLCSLTYGVMLIYRSRKSDMNFIHVHIVATFVVLTMLSALFLFPVIDRHKSARPFCAPVRELVEQGVDFDLYTVGFAREEYVFYSRHFTKELYTDLIPLDNNYGMDTYEMVKFQRALSRTISKAVEDVGIGNIAAISPEELGQLQQAIREVMGKEEYGPEMISDFQKALEKVSEEFFTVFDSGKPAFLYVQENDWRWIYAINPNIQGASVVKHTSVGSREVLLVANPAGAKLISSN